MTNTTLKHVCLNITDGEHNTVINDNSGNHFLLSSKNIKNGNINITDEDRRISESTAKKINNRTKMEPGDVVISTVGTIGESAIVRDNANFEFQRSVGILKPNTEKITSEFLYYLTKTYGFLKEAQRHTTGSVQECLFIGGLEKIKIPNYSIQEQNFIVSQLKPLDVQLKINNDMLSNLEEYSKLLFHKWFVDFNFPDENGNPYKDAGGEMVEVDGKMIPKGWDKTTIGKISINFDSKRIPLSDNQRKSKKGNYPYYGATKIMDYIDEYIFEGNYCLIAEDGSVIDDKNKPIMQYATGKFWVNNHTHVLQGNKVSTEYLYLTLCRTNVMGAVTGAIQKKINQQNLNRLPAILPKKSILVSFDTIILPLFHKITLLKKENQLLEETRNLLIKKLIK